jgi:hypothetical protein
VRTAIMQTRHDLIRLVVGPDPDGRGHYQSGCFPRWWNCAAKIVGTPSRTAPDLGQAALDRPRAARGRSARARSLGRGRHRARRSPCRALLLWSQRYSHARIGHDHTVELRLHDRFRGPVSRRDVHR